jgi:hypothetical protein
MNHQYKHKNKIRKDIKVGLTSMIACILIMTGCVKEEVNVTDPKLGPVPIQMHNFNSQSGGLPFDGSAPDIYYFKQKEDGSYVFTLTSNIFQDIFTTHWASQYILVQADSKGLIKKTETISLPVIEGVTGTFDLTNDAPPNYIADDKGLLYYTFDTSCGCGERFFSLDPEKGLARSFLESPRYWGEPIPGYRTSDDGFITIATQHYICTKYSKSGIKEFAQPVLYPYFQPSSVYLTDKDGDYYFITLYNGPDYTTFLENNAQSFFEVYAWQYGHTPTYDIELRFGPGKAQKAHRFQTSPGVGQINDWNDLTYQDYVDVPFEVWDITHNRQLMVSFRDQGRDGTFDLLPLDLVSSPAEQFQSREYIMVNDVPYSTTPDPTVMAGGYDMFFNNYFIWPYLAEGATWNPSSLPVSNLAIKSMARPGPQLVKVNAGGSSVAKEDFLNVPVPIKNVFKAVPYNDGFAVLFNAPQIYGGYQPTQLVILDADFNQVKVINMAPSADNLHQLESHNDRVFYASVTNPPNGNGGISNRVSLLISEVRNDTKIDRYLDDFIQYKLEKFRITPTKEGGVAIAVWVKPTNDTRDLLFIELDENLELVKK